MAAQDVCVAPPAPGTEVLLAQGRFWHALRSLPPLPARGPLPPEIALPHARALEGIGRAEALEAVLARVRGADTVPALLAIAARRDQAAGRWPDAERRYRRLAAIAEDDSTRRASLVQLGLVLEQAGRPDSAIAVWQRAAEVMPDIADWFDLRQAVLAADTATAFAALGSARTPGARGQARQIAAARRLAAGNLVGALDAFRLLGRPLEMARVEHQLGQVRIARMRADSVLRANPEHPDGLLAANFLIGNYDSALALPELLAIARASLAARADPGLAERYALRAVARSDTSVQAWLLVARARAVQRRYVPALRAIDGAGARAGRQRATLVASERVRVLVAAGRGPAADSLLRQLVRAHPADSFVAGALLEAASRDRVRGDTASERSRYRVLLGRFADTPAAVLARYRLGLLHYASGVRDTAALLVGAAGRRDTARTLGIGPRYWTARLRLEAGDTLALVTLRTLADEQPTTFYGVRARELAGGSFAPVDTAFAPPRPGSFPPAQARSRLEQLVAVGLTTEARLEARGWLSDPSAGVPVLAAAARASTEADLVREAIALGDAVRRRAGMVPVVLRALYSYPYRSVIEGEAAERCIDPLLVAALIRQESRFEPHALSRAGARGLSQVMPATGKELAARVGIREWDPDLLYVPDFNLHLGAAYIWQRVVRDSFPLQALLASYNAGPARVARWRAWPEFHDPDLFTERVTIAETRDYVRNIYASYRWYQATYGLPSSSP